jgi:RNA polymerase sigma-70 factor (ECF subfamily)
MDADSEYIHLLRVRQETAVQALVERHYSAIYRYLYRHVGSADLAEELCQETFLKAYAALPRLADNSNLTAWLYKIATNEAHQHHRRRRLLAWLPLPFSQQGDPGHEGRVVEHDTVHRVLARLPEAYRSALLLQIWAGLDGAEIAAVLGRSEAATRTLLLRARQRFRSLYEEEHP